MKGSYRYYILIRFLTDFFVNVYHAKYYLLTYLLTNMSLETTYRNKLPQSNICLATARTCQYGNDPDRGTNVLYYGIPSWH